MAKSRLHEDEIQAIILGENMWQYTNPIAGIELQVRRKDELKARVILNSIEEHDDQCPICDSWDTEERKNEGIADFLRVVFIDPFIADSEG